MIAPTATPETPGAARVHRTPRRRLRIVSAPISVGEGVIHMTNTFGNRRRLNRRDMERS